jgi:hypothetical protein
MLIAQMISSSDQGTLMDLEKLSALTDAQINLKQLQHLWHQQREIFVSELSEVNGSLPWENIKQQLSKQCDRKNRIENNLYLKLVDKTPDSFHCPLVFECLDNSFVELIKNSIDAMVGLYLADNDIDKTLEMTVQLSVQDEDVEVRITDNAGGFSETYLGNFAGYLESKQYKYALGKDHKQQGEYYFGGRNRGIPILCNLLLDGEQLLGHGNSKPYYSVPARSTFINIENNPATQGAEIALKSPLTQFLKLNHEKESALSPGQLRAAESLSIPSEFKTSLLARRKGRSIGNTAFFKPITKDADSMDPSSVALSSRSDRSSATPFLSEPSSTTAFLSGQNSVTVFLSEQVSATPDTPEINSPVKLRQAP